MAEVESLSIEILKQIRADLKEGLPALRQEVGKTSARQPARRAAGAGGEFHPQGRPSLSEDAILCMLRARALKEVLSGCRSRADSIALGR